MARVKAGEIGDLRLIEIQCSGWDIINAGIHWLNFVVALTQQEPVDWVMACADSSTRTYRDNIQVETMAVTYVQLRNGTRVVMNTGDYVKTYNPAKSTLFQIVGTQGIIEFYAWESRYRITNGSYPQGLDVEVDPGDRSRHQLHLENLANQMDAGRPDYAVAESSLTALEICEAAFLSSEQRRLIPLPLGELEPAPDSQWKLGIPYPGQGGGRDGRQLPPQPSGKIY
jgi:predicted dehydrogenase